MLGAPNQIPPPVLSLACGVSCVFGVLPLLCHQANCTPPVGFGDRLWKTLTKSSAPRRLDSSCPHGDLGHPFLSCYLQGICICGLPSPTDHHSLQLGLGCSPFYTLTPSAVPSTLCFFKV